MLVTCGPAVTVAFAVEVSVSVICRGNYAGVCRGGVCVSDLCCRNHIDVCKGVQNCQVKASYKNVKQEYPTRAAPYKTVK